MLFFLLGLKVGVERKIMSFALGKRSVPATACSLPKSDCSQIFQKFTVESIESAVLIYRFHVKWYSMQDVLLI